MKIFSRPTGLHSRAMIRVADALEKYAPKSVEFVKTPEEADLRILHMIGGPGAFVGMDENQPHAIIQYCMKTAGFDNIRWSLVFQRAQLVWSYYDLAFLGAGRYFDFYHAPLGVDHSFIGGSWENKRRDIGILTSGYVSGPGAEAIEQVATAASTAGSKVVHLGPRHVEGMRSRPAGWTSMIGIKDEELRRVYSRCEYVSGLRHIEGFELPAVEGLVCGARPIVFEREETKKWYDGHAVFIKETTGEELIELITEVLRHRPAPVTESERKKVLDTFNWERIATGFWERLL